jgi:hypothetical protein
MEHPSGPSSKADKLKSHEASAILFLPQYGLPSTP